MIRPYREIIFCQRTFKKASLKLCKHLKTILLLYNMSDQFICIQIKGENLIFLYLGVAHKENLLVLHLVASQSEQHNLFKESQKNEAKTYKVIGLQCRLVPPRYICQLYKSLKIDLYKEAADRRCCYNKYMCL